MLCIIQMDALVNRSHGRSRGKECLELDIVPSRLVSRSIPMDDFWLEQFLLHR